MKSRFLKNFTSVVLIITLLLGVTPVYAVEGEISALDEMPYTAASGVFKDTYDGTVTDYTYSAAKAAGIPDGYKGAVLKVAPGKDGAYAGCEFDFSAQEIPTDKIAYITFRVYFPTGHKEMRLLAEKAPGSWVMQAKPENFGAWCDITLTADGQNFNSGMSLASLANKDGNLGKLCLIGRLDTGKDRAYYLDSITICYKNGATDDTVPPVISCESTNYSFLVGEKFNFDGISAYDEFDKSTATISESWSDGAVYSDGTLKEGEHTLTLTATDRSGNSSSVVINVSVKADKSVIALDDVPTTGYIEGVSIYDGQTEYLTPDEAVSEGVPMGYSDGVLKVSGSTARFGMTFDPRALEIPVGLIDKITVRILLYTGENGLRVSNHGPTNWMVLANVNVGSWVEYTMYAGGNGFSNGYRMSDFADVNGNLGIFSIATNDKSGKNVFYIDSITINLKKDDNQAPVINYNGSSDIVTTAGKPFVLDAEAVDTLSGAPVKLEYSFSEGAIDKDGNLLEGVHSCRVSATGYYGHTSYIDLNLVVGPTDVTAPEILIYTEEIYAPAGAFWCVEILGIDDYDEVVVQETWSNKPTDIGGRLIAGEYTLTLRCVDLSGNVSTKIVKLHVTKTDTSIGQIIVCGNGGE